MYFQKIGPPLMTGRNDTDHEGTDQVLLINDTTSYSPPTFGASLGKDNWQVNKPYHQMPLSNTYI